MARDQHPQWDQVCSTDWMAKKRSAAARRREIIDRALEEASQRQAAGREAPQPPAATKPVAAEKAPPSWTEPQTPKEPAWTYPEGPDFASLHLSKTKTIELGSEVYRYSYKEPVFNLEIKGLQFGVNGAYIYRPEQGDTFYTDVLNMYKFDGRFAFGQVDYHSDPSGQLKDEDNYVFELRGIAGYDHYFNDAFRLTGYFGFGFRYLDNDSGGRQSTTGAYGYERVSRYLYMPFGVEALLQPSARWDIVPNFEWDVFLTGEQVSYLSDVSSGYPNLKNDQKRGYGVRGSLRFAHQGEYFNLFLEPFFRYWLIQNSDVTTASGSVYAVTGLEPKNNSTEYGFKLGLQF